MQLQRRPFAHRLTTVALLAVAGSMAQWVQGSPYSDLVASYGPVANWRLGETSGTTAVDATGAHNGTYQNSVTLGANGAIAGDANKAANFGGGANDRVQVSPFGVSGSGITILAWFKANNFGDDRFVAKATGTSVANAHWSLGTDSNDTLKAQIKIAGTTRELAPSVGTMSTDVWYFIAVTYDGSTMRVYLDAVQVGSAAYAGAVSTDATVAVALGNLPAGAGNRAFHGAVDETALFDKALTAPQIAALFAAADGGLRGHWKLTETTGATAVDSSTQLNDGTYRNGVILGSSGPYSGAGDKAANFDGVNDFVALPNQNRYDLTGPMAVAAWIKVDVFDDPDQAIVTKGNNAWRLQRDGSNNGVNFRCEGLSTNTVASSIDVNDGPWHHVVGVYTGSQLQVYVDGVLSNSVSSSGTINRNNRVVEIARNTQGAGREFDGSIHDVRIYSRSLSAAEVARLYGLIGYWKLDESSGAVASDSSGVGRSGTVTGSAVWTAGSVDNALQLDGATKVTVPGLMDAPKNISLAAWVNLTTADSGGSEVVSIGDCIALRLDEGGVAHAFFFNGSTTVNLTLTQTFAGAGWRHFAVVMNDDGNSFELYIDGVLSASTATASSISYSGRGANTVIGSHGNGQMVQDFNGKIDDVRIYNRAIGPVEVQALFNGGNPPSGVRILQWVETR